MKSFVLLLRGINVGGKNKISMVELKRCLEEQGYKDVITYIQSGNVVLQSDLDAKSLGRRVETMLSKNFKLDSSIIKVLVLTQGQLQAVIDEKPKGFGEQPEKYHSDVIFLMDIDTAQAMTVFNPREGVDQVWQGDRVIYSQRFSELRTKSRLSRIMASPLYKSMTIRSWNTTSELLSLVKFNNKK